MNTIFSKEKRSYLMGIAIIFITLFHWSGNASDYPLHKIISLLFDTGNWGNKVFFLLSSYGLCFSYENNSISCFYKKRLFRLYPLVLLYFVIVLILEKESFNDFLIELPKQITGYSLVTNYCKAWFIQGLTILYIAFPFLFKLIEVIYRKGLIVTFIFIFFLLISSIFIYPFYAHMFYTNFSCIVAGVVLYLCEKENNEYFLISFIGYLGLLSLTTLSKNHGLFIPCVLVLLSSQKCMMPFEQFFKFCGKHTLELYLSQILILPFIPVWDGWRYFLSFASSIILLYLLSLVFYFFQKYSLRLIKH